MLVERREKRVFRRKEKEKTRKFLGERRMKEMFRR